MKPSVAKGGVKVGKASICDIYKTMDIQSVIKKRGITRLCHMTEIENLLAILEKGTGILASDFIASEKRNINDYTRLDGRTDYISTSVQYPNVWYYNYKKSDKDWCIIFIDTSICRRDNTLFCPVNAATQCGAYLETGANSFRSLFADEVNGRERTETMLECCPTDDQAEIMIYKEIPVSYIQGIAFENHTVSEKFRTLAEERCIEWPSLYLTPDLFNTSLSRKIRAGVRPPEIIYDEESELWQKDLCL